MQYYNDKRREAGNLPASFWYVVIAFTSKTVECEINNQKG